MGHMWGPEDTVTGPPGSDREIRHLPFAAKNADAQVGRIVHALKKRHILDDTLIVITADHAAQTATPSAAGSMRPITPGGVRCDGDGRAGYGRTATGTTGVTPTRVYRDPSPAIAAFRDALTQPAGRPTSASPTRTGTSPRG